MKFSTEEQAEIGRNSIGKLILIVSIGLLIFVCFGLNGGSAAATIGVLGVAGFFVGLFLTLGNKSQSEIREQHRNIDAQVNLMVEMAKAGMSSSEISDSITAMNTPKRTTDSGTKEIIKGAVIGGIVAGDAGAVVGAAVAKNKLDNERQSKSSHN